jgi:hypothetical protein
MLGACAEKPLQMWIHTAQGRIQLSQSPDLCLTLADGAVRNAGGAQYLRREVGLAPCDALANNRQTWAFEIPD